MGAPARKGVAMGPGVLIDAIEIDSEICQGHKICGCISGCALKIEASIELVVE